MIVKEILELLIFGIIFFIVSIGYFSLCGVKFFIDITIDIIVFYFRKVARYGIK